MEKLLKTVRLRVNEEMDKKIRLRAEAENRPYLHQVRHFLLLGISHDEQAQSNGHCVPTCDPACAARPKPPHRATEWNGKERRSA
jgi:hypothetical protein